MILFICPVCGAREMHGFDRLAVKCVKCKVWMTRGGSD